MGSCISVFSNASADAAAIDHQDRDTCIKLREEKAACIEKIEEEVRKMLESCKVQTNINMTIKNGLKNLTNCTGG